MPEWRSPVAAVELCQQLVGLRLVQVHFQFREGFVQRRDDLRQQIRPHGRDQADVQRPDMASPCWLAISFNTFTSRSTVRACSTSSRPA